MDGYIESFSSNDTVVRMNVTLARDSIVGGLSETVVSTLRLPTDWVDENHNIIYSNSMFMPLSTGDSVYLPNDDGLLRVVRKTVFSISLDGKYIRIVHLSKGFNPADETEHEKTYIEILIRKTVSAVKGLLVR